MDLTTIMRFPYLTIPGSLCRLVIGTLEKVVRPLLSNFLGNQQTKNQGKKVLGENFQDYLREYQALGDEFQEAMSLQDFFTIKYKNTPRDQNRGQ
jgi:hypothetical protein